MLGLRPFQIGLLAVFAIFGLLALFLISNYRPEGTSVSNQYGSQVVVWGSLEPLAFDRVFSVIRDDDKNFRAVQYYQVDERNFESSLVNAIAEGRSPDLIILPHDQLVRLRSKLTAISYETITQRSIRDNYVDGAEIFARNAGVYAIPFLVDPLVMYWNRDVFAAAGLAQAPATWEEVVGTVLPRLTVRDTNRTIIRSALAFGEYRNIRNAGPVLSLLLLQSGSRMIEEGERGYVVGLNESISGTGRPPMEAAVQFYTDFSNSNSPAYSWNRAQPEDRNAFLAGDLALYFGFGSEVGLLAERNPNLNYDTAAVPQGASATTRRTFGTFYGLAIPLAAPNRSGAYAAAQIMSSARYAPLFAAELSLAPVQRSVLAVGSSDAFTSVMYNSALIARGWLDPNPTNTAGIFQTMVEDIVSNRARVSNAVADAVDKISLSF